MFIFAQNLNMVYMNILIVIIGILIVLFGILTMGTPSYGKNDDIIKGFNEILIGIAFIILGILLF